MMTSRVFSREELDRMGLPNRGLQSSDDPDGVRARVFEDEYFDSGRWEDIRELVFEAPDDRKFYKVSYSEPATEMQEGIDPWDDESSVDAVEVRLSARLVSVWTPVDDDHVLAVPVQVLAEALRTNGHHVEDVDSFSQNLEVAVRSYVGRQG